MTIIMRSGSKISVFSKNLALLAAIAKVAHTVVVVGNQFVGTHVTFSEKFWTFVHQLIFGW